MRSTSDSESKHAAMESDEAATLAAATTEGAAASVAEGGSGLAPSSSVEPPLPKKRKSSFVSQLSREWGPGGLWV
jgi:hypothetical protein